jgi:serine/threonine-protein kinase
MTPCPDPQTLRLYLAEELDGTRRDEVDAHVTACPACQEALRGMLPSLPLPGIDAPTVHEVPSFDPDPDEQPPAIPGYVLSGDRLGSGGMGVVWLGRDTRLNRAAAVKVMRHRLCGQPHVERRFVEEAQVASQLAHPAIPPVYELGTLPDGRPYFAMKVVKGRTLTDLLNERPGPAADRARLLTVFEQVCQGVAHAHSKGVIHRDLKPANVMVGAFGEVQVMDWGLAKVLTDTAGADRPPAEGGAAGSVVETLRSGDTGHGTQTGTLLGTLHYMPPEQARGEVGRLDERCDVFALGAILCEVLTGKPPYDGTWEELKAQAQVGHLGPAQERLAACGADEELVRLARSCLGARPEDRPADASAVAQAVASYQAGVQERLRRAEVERAAAEARAVEERKRRRVARVLAATAVALVAVAAGGGLFVQQQRAERRADQARRDAEQRYTVESALDRAAVLRQQARWREAAAVLEQARTVLGGAGPYDLRHGLDRALAEVELVIRLDAIRQRHAINLVEGSFDAGAAQRQYEDAFQEAGLGVVGSDPEAVAARVRASGAAGQLVAALDDWALASLEDDPVAARGFVNGVRWLMAVARRADPDPSWRDRFREELVRRTDDQALRDLADEALRDDGAKLGAISPQLLVSLGALLGGEPQGVRLLRAAQRRYPDDFWLNLRLGIALRKAKQFEEAAGYYRVAVALRPDVSAVHNNLGNALRDKGDPDGAIAAYHTALALDPKFALAYYNLGNAWRDKGDPDKAIAAYEKAIEYAPKLAPAYSNLGRARHDKGDLDGAIAAHRKAIEIDDKNAYAYSGLGRALMKQGHFAEAREAMARCLELHPAADALRAESAQLQLLCERLAAADGKLPAVLRGEREPADAAERAALGQLCQFYRRRYAAAARFYAGAFAADPRLADDLDQSHRYNAACCAALAATGQGEDAKDLTDETARALRRQALGWLRAELALYAQIADRDEAARQLMRQNLAHWPGEAGDVRADDRARQTVRRNLAHWQRDGYLVSVRDGKALDKLPDDERRDWRRLWEDVGQLLRKVELRK